MISADTLVLLSDIDGLYESDPRENPEAVHLPRVGDISPAIEAMAGKAPAGSSSGGMETKISAAKIATAAGCRMVISNGVDTHPLERLAAGARCTWFVPSASPLTARKRWIDRSLNPVGEIVVDAGAQALKRKELAAGGRCRCRGSFCARRCRDHPDRTMGRSLDADYPHTQMLTLCGLRSQKW